jgi:hypothetical protein
MADIYHVTDPAYWELDRRDRDALIHQIADTPPDDVNAERSLEASILALQDVGRLADVVALVAFQVGKLTVRLEQLEQYHNGHKPRTRRPRLTVRADPEQGVVYFQGKRTPASARALGNQLLIAADMAEGAERSE